MMKRIATFLAWLALTANVAAQTSIGQLPAGTVAGNPTAATIPTPRPATLTAIFDQAYCNTVGFLIVRFTGAWTCSKSIAADPTWWGADPTGAADSRAAFLAAVAANNFVRFPAGTFNFSSSAAYTIGAGISQARIEGAGPDLTILRWATGSALTITYAGNGSSAHVRDLTIATGAANAGTGLLLTNPTADASPGFNAQSDITNVTFRGSDGYPPTATAFYWTTALNLTNISNINIVNVLINGPFGSGGYSTSGVGIGITGLVASTTYGAAINISNSSFNSLNIGIIYGSFVQGVTISQSNFTGDTFCAVTQGSETGVLAEFNIINSQFNCTLGLNLVTAVNSPTLIGNTILVPAGGTGINLPSASGFIAIIGNTIDGIGGGTTGINIATGNSGVVANNNILNNATAIANASALMHIHDNAGYNPVGYTAGTSTGTSASVISAGGSPETHYITQSANFNAVVAKCTALACGTSTNLCTVPSATVPCVLQLGPNESYKVTWVTTQPTYTKDIH